ncbi:MAG: hypothetical protein ACYCY2_08015 [Acidithiobacillus ferriphilus]
MDEYVYVCLSPVSSTDSSTGVTSVTCSSGQAQWQWVEVPGLTQGSMDALLPAFIGVLAVAVVFRWVIRFILNR